MRFLTPYPRRSSTASQRSNVLPLRPMGSLGSLHGISTPIRKTSGTLASFRSSGSVEGEPADKRFKDTLTDPSIEMCNAIQNSWIDSFMLPVGPPRRRESKVWKISTFLDDRGFRGDRHDAEKYRTVGWAKTAEAWLFQHNFASAFAHAVSANA